MTKKIAIAVLGSALASTYAGAEEVTATKKAPLQNFLPDSYGEINLYHETDVQGPLSYGNAGAEKAQPSLVLDYTLGTKTFNDKGDINITLEALTTAATTQVSRGDTTIETSYNLVEGKLGSIVPYMQAFIHPNGADTNGQVGAWWTLKAPAQKTSAGEVGLKMVLDTRAQQAGGQDRLKLPTEGLGLAEAPEDVTVQKDRETLNADLALKANIKLSSVKGLTLATEAKFYNKYQPRYEVVNVDGEARGEFDRYEMKKTTRNSYIISYDLTDSSKISNNLQQFWTGTYDNAADGSGAGQSPRFVNYLTYTATLF